MDFNGFSDFSSQLLINNTNPICNKGFFGNDHFKDANTYLETHNREGITWC